QTSGTQFENAPEPPLLNAKDAIVDSIFDGESFERSLAHWEEQLLDQTPAENFGGINLDLQYGMDFRKPEYRREVFHRFYEFHLKYATHPGCIYFVFPFLFKKHN